MKITAYEVRPDEKDYLLAAAQQEQIEITLVQGPMTQDNIDRAEGADGITILGDTKMDAALIEETAKRRIRVVATRTIGYDHIDLNAAKSNGVHVCNGYYDPDGVAEYTVMLILMSLRNYKQALFRGNANDYSLGGLIGRELRNLTVGIIGTGKSDRRCTGICRDSAAGFWHTADVRMPIRRSESNTVLWRNCTRRVTLSHCTRHCPIRHVI